MTRWMMLAAAAAAASAVTGSAFAQADSRRREVNRPVRVGAEAVVVAEADDLVPPPPTPAPARARAGATAAAPAAPALPGVPPQPVPPVVIGDKLIEARPVKLEKVAYLGAIASTAPAAMREQLKLAPGVGLVVERVEPDSAAERAGIKQHDLLEKLDDQMLINPAQLATLLRSKKAGDEVTLSIVRHGEHQSVKARLEEKEVDANAAYGFKAVHDAVPLQTQFKTTTAAPNTITLTDRDGSIALFGGGGGGGGAFGGAGGFGGGFAAAGGGRRVTVRTMDDGKQTTVWADDEVSISIDRAAGKITNMVVKDRKTDKPLYTGNGEGDDLKTLYDARPDLKDKVRKAQDAANRDPARLPIQGVLNLKNVAMGGPGRVVRWQDDDHVLLMRMTGKSPSYLLALSKKDGRTVFDGPVATPEDRQGVPAEVAEQFQMICGQPELAQELGGPPAPPAPAKPRFAPPTPATPKDGL